MFQSGSCTHIVESGQGQQAFASTASCSMVGVPWLVEAFMKQLMQLERLLLSLLVVDVQLRSGRVRENELENWLCGRWLGRSTLLERTLIVSKRFW
jgi:hypothetical protein